MPPRRDRLNHRQAASLRQVILEFPDLPRRARVDLLSAVERVTETGTGRGWFFMMVDPVRNVAVQEWLFANSRRSQKALSLWSRCLVLADRHDGEVPLDRNVMAKELDVQPIDVSRMLGDLTKCHALLRERRPGGGFTYRVNPRVATNLPEEPRTIAQIAAPEITGITNRFPFTPLRVIA